MHLMEANCTFVIRSAKAWGTASALQAAVEMGKHTFGAQGPDPIPHTAHIHHTPQAHRSARTMALHAGVASLPTLLPILSSFVLWAWPGT